MYLQVGPTGAQSWIFRFMLNGKARAMGLGPPHAMTMTEARAHAAECRMPNAESSCCEVRTR
ncbi:Arm DNA-binding domain-containing protein [Accumulibacter sp.]|uniref:Arm DNA-binding domain-containing protein n=1 Tax=Accumulibacter sp. TaxID=2053492 RepID=UPI0035B1F6EF